VRTQVLLEEEKSHHYSAFKAISSLEEKGMQSDPRYGQLMAMANRTKGGMGLGYGGPRDQNPNLGGGGMDNMQMSHPGAQGKECI